MLARMPASAVVDMMEWGPAKTPEEQFDLLVSHRTSSAGSDRASANTPALQDDRPINEYYWLRTKYPGLMKNLQ